VHKEGGVALNIKISFLLTGKTGLWQVLGCGATSHCYPGIVAKFVVGFKYWLFDIFGNWRFIN
jgi:hypothetical protein